MRIYLSIVFALFACYAVAQSTLPTATNFKKAYAGHTRDISGKPGVNYWQNRADYNIDVAFDPANMLLKGTVKINYINNSPDTLKQLVFKLYPNLFQAQAMRNVLLLPQDLNEGVKISAIAVSGQIWASKDIVIRGTNMYVKKVTVLPGAHADIEVVYAYTLNNTSFMRTGKVEDGAYMIAYFFPRVAVYDDIDQWNEYPYAGKEEFYNDYCNFKAAITIPAGYQAWATGGLKNTAEVYESKYADRIAAAENNDAITKIISADDLKAGGITKNSASGNTWHFEALNVTDFAFAISNHYVWDATSVMVDSATKRRTRVDAVYNPAHTNFLPVINFARSTVEAISYKVPGIPFPYPHQTIFEGLDAMEYPMMVNNLPFDKNDAAYFTAHEIFHALFPFYVGSNETKYSFMDEGLATFAEFTLRPMIEQGATDEYDLSSYNTTAGSDQDVPIITLTPQLYGKARFADKDLKPALGLRYLKEMLGDKVFYDALKYYMETWKGKHPTPYDFFACMNAGANANLNWFWQNWFFEKNIPDLAILQVNHQQKNYAVTISNLGKAAVPVHLNVFYVDGTKETLSRNIFVWAGGSNSIGVSFTAKSKIVKMVLGDGYDADVDATNNVWAAK